MVCRRYLTIHGMQEIPHDTWYVGDNSRYMVCRKHLTIHGMQEIPHDTWYLGDISRYMVCRRYLTIHGMQEITHDTWYVGDNSRVIKQLERQDIRKFGNINKISKLHRSFLQFSSQNENIFNTRKIEKKKLSFSRHALFQTRYQFL